MIIFTIIFTIIITIIIIVYIYNKFKSPCKNIKTFVDQNNDNKLIPCDLRPFFSSITSRLPSIFDKPLYYLSSPIQYIVNKGEYIYIPANYWHWVISTNNDDDYNFAVNYWFYKKYEKNNTYFKNNPHVGKFTDNYNDIINLFNENIKVHEYNTEVWCPYNYRSTTLNKFITNKDEYNTCYMSTMENKYKKNNNSDANYNFFNKFKNHVPIPKVLDNIKIYESIFWLNNGGIESPLHYDDYDGLLCVISGQIIVTLFPPSDSKYLYPLY
jgi:hypothetical protein